MTAYSIQYKPKDCYYTIGYCITSSDISITTVQ